MLTGIPRLSSQPSFVRTYETSVHRADGSDAIDLVSDTTNLDTFIRTCRDAVEAAQGHELPPWRGLPDSI